MFAVSYYLIISAEANLCDTGSPADSHSLGPPDARYRDLRHGDSMGRPHSMGDSMAVPHSWRVYVRDNPMKIRMIWEYPQWKTPIWQLKFDFKQQNLGIMRVI